MTQVKPTLLILAAGMGSRYGGLKQLDGVGPSGETIMDYSIYDAIQVGFGRIVFVIRQDFEDEFRSIVLPKYEGKIPVELVFQEVDKLPEGYACPEGRQRPWGTNHAVMMGGEVIREEPFAVINADDFYGRNGYEVLVEKLRLLAGQKGRYCMVGYRLGNTLSDSGKVSRGVCAMDENNRLTGVSEHTGIARQENGVVVGLNAKKEEVLLHETIPVSMNMWGFTPDYFDHSWDAFSEFLKERLAEDKSEFFIPTVVDDLIAAGKATVEVLDTEARWFGVTYVEDRPSVVSKLAELTAQGVYPSPLF